MKVKVEILNFPPEVQILYQFKQYGPCAWKCDAQTVPLYGSSLPYKGWIRIVRDHYRAGYLKRGPVTFGPYRSHYPGAEQQTITAYSITGKGHELLEELGL